MVSCSEESAKVFPLTDESTAIFYSVKDKQVAFHALTHSAVSWHWDFGDGTTSDEQNPVHIYEGGGYYNVVLTAKDKKGTTVEKTVKIGVNITPYVLLTGGAGTANGKTWKLSASHSGNGDYMAYADATLTAYDGVPDPLPDGVMDLMLGMGEVYDDTYTFFFDGSYSHDVKDDGAAFAGIVNQFMTNGGVDIVNANGSDFGLCTAKYTPEGSATFTFTEDTDLTISSVFGNPDGGYALTYKGVTTLEFSGTEFIGFWDKERRVIVKELTEKKMTLIMFMAASPDYYPLNTNALILSFEVVE